MTSMVSTGRLPALLGNQFLERSSLSFLSLSRPLAAAGGGPRFAAGSCFPEVDECIMGWGGPWASERGAACVRSGV